MAYYQVLDMGDGIQVYRKTIPVSNKRSWTAYKGWLCSLSPFTVLFSIMKLLEVENKIQKAAVGWECSCETTQKTTAWKTEEAMGGNFKMDLRQVGYENVMQMELAQSHVHGRLWYQHY